MKTLSIKRLGFLTMLGLVMAMSMDTAYGAQQKWASQYVAWTFDQSVGAVWNIDQQVWIPEPNRTSFWPLQWSWLNVPGVGGYMGLQEGDLTQNVRFSLWKATEARGAHCQEFAGEGVGYTCTLPVEIDTRKFYRLRLWRLQTAPDGQWWGGWLIEEGPDGALTERNIGQIKVPLAYRAVAPGSITNFVEFFGPALDRCDEVPLSVAAFTPPAVNYHGKGTGVYGGYSKYGGSNKATGNTCTTGGESDGAMITAKPYDFGFAEGVMVFLGGDNACHNLNPRAHPTPPDMPDS